MDKKQRSISRATIAAQLGGYVDPQSAGVTPPLSNSTTYIRDRSYDPVRGNNLYGRDQNDTVRQAEDVIRALEDAAAAALFPSGMAAISHICQQFDRSRPICVQSGIYWGTTHWFQERAARTGVELVQGDYSNADILAQDVERYQPGLVFVETPSNPWLKIVDLQKTTEIAHNSGARVIVDSTAATPILTRPLSFGADFVVHSATKYLNGHSDMLGGVVCTNDPDSDPWTKMMAMRHDAGAIISPFDAWLLMRGLRTLALRVIKSSENALKIAKAMASHPKIQSVLYPGLPDHPQHDIARAQMIQGFGGLLSILVDGDRQTALDVAGQLNLFHRATSLGGVESLVEHRFTIEPHTGIPENLLRLAVGIEDADDLIADLNAALT